MLYLSLPAGGDIPCRPNPAAILLVANAYLPSVSTSDRRHIAEDVLRDIWSWLLMYLDCAFIKMVMTLIRTLPKQMRCHATFRSF